MGFGPISGTGLTSYSLGVGNIEITAVAMHSNPFEFGTVRAICLAPSHAGEPGTSCQTQNYLVLTHSWCKLTEGCRESLPISAQTPHLVPGTVSKIGAGNGLGPNSGSFVAHDVLPVCY